MVSDDNSTFPKQSRVSLNHSTCCTTYGVQPEDIGDLTRILGRQRDDDGQNKLLQINGSKDNSSYIINRINLIQS